MRALRIAIALLATAPLALTITRLAGWWPCTIACQGGGYYQRIAGYDVLWGALAAYAVLALLTWRDAFRRRWSGATAGLAGGLTGVTLFYLLVAYQLHIRCPFCLTVHATVLGTLVGVCADATGPAAVGMVIALLGANAAFHHQVVADVVDPAPGTGAITLNATAATADANRVRGTSAAPFTVEYGYSLQCGHCAAQHRPLLDALAPLIAAGRARLVLRPVVRPADPGSRLLALWSFAAAARSPAVLDTYLLAHLDTREGLDRGQLMALGGDLPALAAAAEGGGFDSLVDGDQRRLRRLGYQGATPFVAVVSGDRVVARYAQDVPLDTLLDALEAPPAATPAPARP